MDANRLTPKQAAEIVGIPTRTLRRWANEFGSSLSEGARQKKGRWRSYDGQDIQILQKAKELLNKGTTLEGVAQVLPLREAEEKTSALMLSPEVNLAMLQAVDQSARALERIEGVRDRVEDLRERQSESDRLLASLEAWLTQPWYNRLFSKPGGSDER